MIIWIIDIDNSPSLHNMQTENLWKPRHVCRGWDSLAFLSIKVVQLAFSQLLCKNCQLIVNWFVSFEPDAVGMIIPTPSHHEWNARVGLRIFLSSWSLEWDGEKLYWSSSRSYFCVEWSTKYISFTAYSVLEIEYTVVVYRKWQISCVLCNWQIHIIFSVIRSTHIEIS
jgi:hypothetical protein